MALMSRGKETGADGVRGLADDSHRETHHYWAFLSYSHADSVDADWLHQAVERFTMPKALVGRMTATGAVPKKLSPIFRDRHELAASSDLGGKIRAALKQSRFLIVLCSPAAAGSRWVNEEILAFKKLHGERRILAAIVGGEPWASEIAGREGEECFPPALREKIDRKGLPTGKRAEPIAADLRRDGGERFGRDGREAGKLKLVAGMLGLGLDDLVRREQQRRQKRLTYVAAAALAGMAVTSGLAVFAFDKRDEARDQRREAEGLVGFMLGDLRDELEPIGRLDALDAVGSRALKYFERQDKKELSDPALIQRSKALALMGEIATARGDLVGSAARYREAMAGTAEMIRRQPNDPQRLFDHAQNVFYLSEVESGLGHTAPAETWKREYKRLADQMVSIEPANPKWQTEVGYADTNLGIVLFNRHRYADASKQFAESLNIVTALARSDPANRVKRQSVAEALGWYADALLNGDKIKDAIVQRQRQMSVLDSLMTKSSDVDYRARAIPALRALGKMLVATGEADQGELQSRRAVKIAEQLMPAEPTNMYWVELAAGARLDLGAILLAGGNKQEAASEIAAGCSLGDRLNRGSMGTPARRELGFICLTRRIELALALRSGDEAIMLAPQAIRAAKQVNGPDKVRNAYALAISHKLMGDALALSGDRKSAFTSWTNALQLWPTTAAGPRLLGIKSSLLEDLGRTAEARSIQQRLEAIGYKKHV